MDYEPMSYERLLKRGEEARLRGNEELAKALFARALEVESKDKKDMGRKDCRD